MQSQSQVQQVWDSLVLHLKSLSDGLQLAHEVFTQPEEEVKGMSCTTLRRRRQKSLDNLSKGKDNVDLLLMHASQVFSATSHWQAQVDAAESARQAATNMLEGIGQQLQESLSKLSRLESDRQHWQADIDLARKQAADQEAEVRSLHCQVATLADDSETALLRASQADARALRLQNEAEQLRQAASHAASNEQAATEGVQGLQAEASKAKATAERLQQMVASLTADNLVFVMRLKRSERELVAVREERDELRLAADEQRGPWFDEVKAGVESRVKAALTQATELQAAMEEQQEEHAIELSEAQQQMSLLQQELSRKQEQCKDLCRQLDDACHAATRAEEAAATAAASTSRSQHHADQLAADKRAMAECTSAMRQECSAAWAQQQAALGKVKGLNSKIAALQRDLQQLQAQVVHQQGQLQHQVAINAQLMQRKEQMEWQLLTVLAQGGGRTPNVESGQGNSVLQDSTNFSHAMSHESSFATTARKHCSLAHQTEAQTLDSPTALSSHYVSSTTDMKENKQYFGKATPMLQQNDTSSAAIDHSPELTVSQQQACKSADPHAEHAVDASALDLNMQQVRMEGESNKESVDGLPLSLKTEGQPLSAVVVVPTRQPVQELLLVNPLGSSIEDTQELGAPSLTSHLAAATVVSADSPAIATDSPCRRMYSASVTTTRPTTPASPV